MMVTDTFGESWLGVGIGHHRFYFRLYVFKLGEFELVALHLLFLIGLFGRLMRHFHLRWRFLVALLQHVGNRVSLLLHL